jgi:hypothetical protein
MPQRSVVETIALFLVFGGMLTATSPTKDSEARRSAAPDRDGKAAEAPAVPTVTIPATDTWTRTEVPTAGLTLRLPPGARVDQERSGNDPGASGRYVDVVMGPGLEFQFCDGCSAPAISIEESRSFYAERAIGFEGYTYEADDALVAQRKDPAPVGSYCETVVCAKQLTKPICGEATAFEDEHGAVTKLSEEQCLAVVAIGRSLEERKAP